jgi:hypothetical protein
MFSSSHPPPSNDKIDIDFVLHVLIHFAESQVSMRTRTTGHFAVLEDNIPKLLFPCATEVLPGRVLRL